MNQLYLFSDLQPEPEPERKPAYQHRPFRFPMESLVDAFGFPPIFRIVCMLHGLGYHNQPKCMNDIQHVRSRIAYSSGAYDCRLV